MCGLEPSHRLRPRPRPCAVTIVMYAGAILNYWSVNWILAQRGRDFSIANASTTTANGAKIAAAINNLPLMNFRHSSGSSPWLMLYYDEVIITCLANNKYKVYISHETNLALRQKTVRAHDVTTAELVLRQTSLASSRAAPALAPASCDCESGCSCSSLIKFPPQTETKITQKLWCAPPHYLVISLYR